MGIAAVDHDQQWLDFGFGLVENVPTAPGSVVKVVELFGYVRETNYGQVLATPTKTRWHSRIRVLEAAP